MSPTDKEILDDPHPPPQSSQDTHVSMQALTWARAQTTGSPASKLILLLLADYASPGPADGPHPPGADGRHYTWAGVASVAQAAEMSPSSAKRHEARLVELGLIRKIRRFDRAGNRRTDWLVLAVDNRGHAPFPDETGQNGTLDGHNPLTRGNTTHHSADPTSGQSDLRSPVTPGPKLTGDPYKRSKERTLRSDPLSPPTVENSPARARASARPTPTNETRERDHQEDTPNPPGEPVITSPTDHHPTDHQHWADALRATTHIRDTTNNLHEAVHHIRNLLACDTPTARAHLTRIAHDRKPTYLTRYTANWTAAQLTAGHHTHHDTPQNHQEALTATRNAIHADRDRTRQLLAQQRAQALTDPTQIAAHIQAARQALHAS